MRTGASLQAWLQKHSIQSIAKRSLILVGSSLILSGCASNLYEARITPRATPEQRQINAAYLAMYDERLDEKFPLPATDISEINPRFYRHVVDYPRADPPGTIVIDPGNKFLYLVQENGRAIRYGVGVGRAGLVWSGKAQIKRKAEWPRWTPTPEMVARDPDLNGPWRSGMEGGLENPLGARAMYLYVGDRDTMYRIHGTTEPETIGTNVSSGCIRMINQDVIDLYNRVPIGTNVVVLPAGVHVESADAYVALMKPSQTAFASPGVSDRR